MIIRDATEAERAILAGAAVLDRQIGRVLFAIIGSILAAQLAGDA